MRRTRQVVAACALGTALFVPAIPLMAQEAAQPAPDAPRPTLTPGNVRPDAALTSTQSGGKVTFDASKSVDSDGSIVSYEWDLDGDGVYEAKTAGEPTVEHSYEPGTTLIAAVRVTDDAGASDDATAPVVVAGAPASAPASAAAPATAQPAEPAAPAEPAVPLVPTDNLDEPAGGSPAVKSPRKKSEPRLVAAASGAVTIKDFEFVPTTVNVNVGDSVTWLNQGPTAHTATADNGSFDSGTLAKGKSFSHKFTKAGTYSYFCKPHPFMKGKVVVSGSGSSGSSGSSGGSSGGSGSSGSGTGSSSGDSGSAGASADSGSSGSLARTGVDLLPWTLFAISLVAFGAALRYRLIED